MHHVEQIGGYKRGRKGQRVRRLDGVMILCKRSYNLIDGSGGAPEVAYSWYITCTSPCADERRTTASLESR